ncbi:Alpha/beta hydrolase [Rhodovastum atsumiense]|uniref:Alpha/beta hydrolase n=1 Tax=Rhodovastum atsumiense TaxID=504468 RepID=A0A5M6IVB8_9PROT|nr:alpha/beta hydrolase [Rhodovastum atsumiense]KAA5612254.1 alpha/beta hydrolase [Rhodovastum atsumiense]CAH2601577.1 Alpha/beta hydrolase [Rhodovastum atsumiense]
MNQGGGRCFVHRFAPATRPALPLLLLLHGTGGDETELLALAASVLPGAAILAPRGQVEENGALRFFRRFADGTLDEVDVARRADHLAGFLAAARTRHRLPPPIVLGFSNGANTAAAMLLRHPGIFAGAVLLRAVPPLRQAAAVAQAGVPVLLVAGADDPIAPPAQGQALAELLRSAEAVVRMHVLDCGHALTAADGTVAREWLEQLLR